MTGEKTPLRGDGSGKACEDRSLCLEYILCLLLVLPGFASAGGWAWVGYSWLACASMFLFTRWLFGRSSVLVCFTAAFLCGLLVALASDLCSS